MTIADFLHQAGFWQWLGLIILAAVVLNSIGILVFALLRNAHSQPLDLRQPAGPAWPQPPPPPQGPAISYARHWLPRSYYFRRSAAKRAKMRRRKGG